MDDGSWAIFSLENPKPEWFWGGHFGRISLLNHHLEWGFGRYNLLRIQVGDAFDPEVSHGKCKKNIWHSHMNLLLPSLSNTDNYTLHKYETMVLKNALAVPSEPL